MGVDRSQQSASRSTRHLPKLVRGADSRRTVIAANVKRWRPAVSFWPVVSVVLFQAWHLRNELRPVSYPNDSSVHLAYVDWAADRLAHGQSPLDGIFTDLGLGFPIFQHYQVLSHLLTAPAAWLFGAASTYALGLYLLMVLWPVCVYGAARLFGLDRAIAASAAVVAPFVMSTPGYGFELSSYSWGGLGMWSQAWGMWLFALGAACAWRAIARRGSLALASALVGALLATHLLTGVALMAAVAVWPLLGPAPRRPKVARTAVVLASGALTSAWLLVPALVDHSGTAFSNPEDTHWSDSYGHRQVLGWLVSGVLFDTGRLPILTVLGAVGLAVALHRVVRHHATADQMRALLGLFAVSLVLFCGSSLIGPIVDRLPAREVLFLHRMIVGVHFAGILLAGLGAAAAARWLTALIAKLVDAVRRVRSEQLADGTEPVRPAWSAAVVAGMAAVIIAAAAARRVRNVVARLAYAARQVSSYRSPTALVAGLTHAARRARTRPSGGSAELRQPAWSAAVVGVVAVVALAPAWTQLASYLDEQTDWVDGQRQADATDGKDFAALAQWAASQGGRVYAGSPNDWGKEYRIGHVSGYIQLLAQRAPGFGFSGRVPSLSEQYEAGFDADSLIQAEVFDVRWQIRPDGINGPPGATLADTRGRHNLWQVDTTGALRLADASPALTPEPDAARAETYGFLTSQMPLDGIYPFLALAGEATPRPTPGRGTQLDGPPGTLAYTHADANGARYRTAADLRRPAVLVAKTSAHPRWSAEIDGQSVPTQAVAPGLLAVQLPPGRHQVELVHRGFPITVRLALVGAGLAGVAGAAILDRRRLLR